ncbi:MAG: TonB-dependent receptor [Pseudomonadota bacterium]|nr:TonB-dependent receptor [Pseudomonadota bacterium]
MVPDRRGWGTSVRSWRGSLSLGGNLLNSSIGEGSGLDLDLNWTPIEALRLNAGYATANAAPTTDKLYAPLVYGDPVSVFDLVTGQAVQVTPLLGGNPDLRAQRSDRLSASVSAGPLTKTGLFLNLSYGRNETQDGVGQLSEPTPALEAAFPERFIRDAEGRLAFIDRRPLNLASATSEDLSTSVSLALPLPRGEDEEPQSLQINLNYAYRLTDRSRFGPGAPVLDRIAGVGGGLPRQTLFLNAETRRGRWSLSTSARWQAGYRSLRGDATGPDDLVVDGFAAVDFRLGVILLPSELRAQGSTAAPRSGRLAGGGQITVEVQNAFDTRPEARLGDGRPAPGYGRDDHDPIGRQVGIQFAKRF